MDNMYDTSLNMYSPSYFGLFTIQRADVISENLQKAGGSSRYIMLHWTVSWHTVASAASD